MSPSLSGENKPKDKPLDIFLESRQGRELNHQVRTWHAYAKNGRIHTENRRIALLSELSALQWDFICFSETRCLTEDTLFHGGHRLITSLQSPAASGVAILVHSDYVKYIIRKHMVSDRVMAIDVKIGTKKYVLFLFTCHTLDIVLLNLRNAWKILLYWRRKQPA